MRIENNMAGYRPSPSKKNSKKTLESVQPALLPRPGNADTSDLDDSGLQNHNEQDPHAIRQKVHKRQKLANAAYVLATRGGL